MKKITQSLKLMFIVAMAALTFAACSDDDSGSTTESTSGDVTFWNNDASIGNISVSVAGRSATITHNINPSSCGESGCANFNLEAGTYSFTAASTTGETWSGNCTVSAGGCLRFNLY